MDVVIAAGVESMTRVPMVTPSRAAGQGRPRHLHEPGDAAALPRRRVQPVHRRRDDREELRPRPSDKLDALRLREPPARDRGHARRQLFADEIVPVEVRLADGPAAARCTRVDEGIRFEATLEGIAGRQADRRRAGAVTAATASQICDGASGVMVVNERGLKALGVKPLARIHHMSVMGHDPVIMLEAPIPATAARARRGRHEDRRHRPLRGQRGLRAGAAGLAAEAGRRPRPAQRQRRRRSRWAIRSAPRAPS